MVILWIFITLRDSLEQKSPMHYVGQYQEKLKFLSVYSHETSYLCIRKFFVKKFPPQKCEAKLVTVTSQPVPRPLPSSYAYSSAQYLSPQPVENIYGCRSGWKF